MRTFVLLLTLLSLNASAEILQSKLHSVVPSSGDTPAFLKMENGWVVFLREGDERYFNKNSGNELLEIETDENNELVGVSALAEEPAPTGSVQSLPVREEATVYETEGQIQTLMNQMNRSWKSNTECTDRAHVWAYEEWRKHNLVSRKVFLFFTNTYIRRYRYHWWFHVSPYTFVKSGEGTAERVIDRRFSRTPRNMKSWTDMFIYSKRTCPESTYRHYRANNNGSEHCYLVKSAMYYRLPLHVRNLEDSGTVKTRFSASEVNFSYRAFTRRTAPRP